MLWLSPLNCISGCPWLSLYFFLRSAPVPLYGDEDNLFNTIKINYCDNRHASFEWCGCLISSLAHSLQSFDRQSSKGSENEIDPPYGGDREILSIHTLSLECVVEGITDNMGPTAREFTINCIDIGMVLELQVYDCV